MQFYTWRATRDAPVGQLRFGSWWISKTMPNHDLVFIFHEYKGGDIDTLKSYFKRLDKAYEEMTTRGRAMASVKLLMAAKAMMVAEKKAVEKPLRATGFSLDALL